MIESLVEIGVVSSFTVSLNLATFTEMEHDDLTKMFNDYATEWSLDAGAVKAAVELAAKDKVATGRKRKRSITPPSKQHLFLYAKGILAEESYPGERKNVFEALLKGATPKLQKALERLTTIVLRGEVTPTRTELDPPTQFDLFIQQHLEWKDGWVAHRDHPGLKGILIFSLQAKSMH
jgi:hypothetical protein